MVCEVCSLLDNDESLVFQTDYWKVFVMDEQSYLGRCVVSCKRHCPSLSGLTIEEWRDFKDVVNKLEGTARKAFGGVLANWTCLMNGAFKSQPYNPHVHWHFFPRYEKPVDFAGRTFTDPDFGEHYEHRRKEAVDKDMINKIVNALKTSLSGIPGQSN